MFHQEGEADGIHDVFLLDSVFVNHKVYISVPNNITIIPQQRVFLLCHLDGFWLALSRSNSVAHHSPHSCVVDLGWDDFQNNIFKGICTVLSRCEQRCIGLYRKPNNKKKKKMPKHAISYLKISSLLYFPSNVLPMTSSPLFYLTAVAAVPLHVKCYQE